MTALSRSAQLMARARALAGDAGHRQVASAALVVASATLLAKIVSAAKDMLVADQFGTEAEVDAFLVAWLAPGLIISVTRTGLVYAFLPAYAELRQRAGEGAGRELLGSTLALALAVFAALSLALAAAVPIVTPWVVGGFEPAKLRLTIQLFWALLPTMLLAGATSAWTAVLNAHGRFAAAASATMAVPLMTMAGLAALGRSWGIHALAAGTVAGHLLEALLVAAAVRHEGVPIVPRWSGLGPGVRRVVQQFWPAASAMIFTSVNPVIDQLMGAQLAPGSIAALGYGNKLVALAMGIGYGSVASAVLPRFSRLHAARDWGELERSVRSYAVLITVVSLPLTLGLVALSTPITRLLFQRGAFTSADTALVSRIQALYLGQLPFVMVSVLFTRFLVATGQNRILLRVSVVASALNVTANYVLLKVLGVAGIALSTTLVYATTCTINFFYYRRSLRLLQGAPEGAAPSARTWAANSTTHARTP